MRLSEAVVLGSTNLKLEPTAWQTTDCGCLIGMGLNAMGHAPQLIQSQNMLDATEVFPWLYQTFPIPEVGGVKLDSGGYDNYNASKKNGCPIGDLFAWQIISLLAFSVYEQLITLEQAVDWIRQNEPAETPEEKREIVETFCDNLVTQQ